VMGYPIGFTQYAREKLLSPAGFVKASERGVDHVFVMKGADPEGKRVIKELRTTLMLAYLTYVGETYMTHLWTVRDGRRHLVHRKPEVVPDQEKENAVSETTS